MQERTGQNLQVSGQRAGWSAGCKSELGEKPANRRAKGWTEPLALPACHCQVSAASCPPAYDLVATWPRMGHRKGLRLTIMSMRRTLLHHPANILKLCSKRLKVLCAVFCVLRFKLGNSLVILKIRYVLNSKIT